MRIGRTFITVSAAGRARVLGFALLATGCVDTPVAPIAAAVESSALARGAVGVPFRGRGEGQDVSIAFEAAGIRIIADATGNATHVGRFTERLDYVLSYDLVHFAGAATITAADGATLRIEFTGEIPGFAEQVFPLPYTSTYSIVGGTGRLSGSTGSGSLRGIDFGGGAFSFAFDGLLVKAK
ncbi:MAG: hypothetical protein IT357_16160 [Gemmatimonadaceae bacterium]|nr:hypothetical protein [Gemmatimonadaceae bacterium]